MKKLRYWIIKKWEIMFLKLAYAIVKNRNIQRCTVISRRDNNYLYQMGEEIDMIIERIQNNYELKNRVE